MAGVVDLTDGVTLGLVHDPEVAVLVPACLAAYHREATPTPTTNCPPCRADEQARAALAALDAFRKCLCGQAPDTLDKVKRHLGADKVHLLYRTGPRSAVDLTF